MKAVKLTSTNLFSFVGWTFGPRLRAAIADGANAVPLPVENAEAPLSMREDAALWQQGLIKHQKKTDILAMIIYRLWHKIRIPIHAIVTYILKSVYNYRHDGREMTIFTCPYIILWHLSSHWCITTHLLLVAPKPPKFGKFGVVARRKFWLAIGFSTLLAPGSIHTQRNDMTGCEYPIPVIISLLRRIRAHKIR